MPSTRKQNRPLKRLSERSEGSEGQTSSKYLEKPHLQQNN